MSWLDTVADYVDTVFGRVPESMNIRDTSNPRNLPRATRKKRITNPYPITATGNIIRDYDAPMPLPPPNVETISRNVSGITKKIRKHLPKQPRGTAKERQQIKDILKEYDTPQALNEPSTERLNKNLAGITKHLPTRGTAKERKELNDRIREYELPHALSDPSSERLHKNLKGISKAISKHLPEAETKESHDSYMNSSTYQNQLIAEQKAREEQNKPPVIPSTTAPVVQRPPRVTTQDGTIQSPQLPPLPPLPVTVPPVVSNEVAIYEPPITSDDTSKAVVVYTPPTIKSVQESVPAVLVPDNIDPETIMKYIKKQSNLRKGRYNPHILNNQSIVEQARIAGLASFSNLRK